MDISKLVFLPFLSGWINTLSLNCFEQGQIIACAPLPMDRKAGLLEELAMEEDPPSARALGLLAKTFRAAWQAFYEASPNRLYLWRENQEPYFRLDAALHAPVCPSVGTDPLLQLFDPLPSGEARFIGAFLMVRDVCGVWFPHYPIPGDFLSRPAGLERLWGDSLLRGATAHPLADPEEPDLHYLPDLVLPFSDGDWVRTAGIPAGLFLQGTCKDGTPHPCICFVGDDGREDLVPCSTYNWSASWLSMVPLEKTAPKPQALKKLRTWLLDFGAGCPDMLTLCAQLIRG